MHSSLPSKSILNKEHSLRHRLIMFQQRLRFVKDPLQVRIVEDQIVDLKKQLKRIEFEKLLTE